MTIDITLAPAHWGLVHTYTDIFGNRVLKNKNKNLVFAQFQKLPPSIQHAWKCKSHPYSHTLAMHMLVSSTLYIPVGCLLIEKAGKCECSWQNHPAKHWKHLFFFSFPSFYHKCLCLPKYNVKQEIIHSVEVQLKSNLILLSSHFMLQTLINLCITDSTSSYLRHGRSFLNALFSVSFVCTKSQNTRRKLVLRKKQCMCGQRPNRPIELQPGAR